jgi:DNA-binding response OmpR family regulator
MPEKKRILVVEDEEDYRCALKTRLEANGYEVLESADGLSGLEAARNEKPDLVILDLMLPRMDGYKVARFLKFDDKHRKMPILMLTARAQQTDRETGLAVGADAYLTKPTKEGELLAVVRTLLGQKT